MTNSTPQFVNVREVRPASFTVENYRAFARRQEVEVRPLTLFFGWNSGGKSALVRFLPLIAESMRVGGPPIWLGGEVGRRATWPELVCKATGVGVLRFGIHWSEMDPLSANWEIAGDLAGQWQEVKNLVVGSENSILVGLPNEAALGDIPGSVWDGQSLIPDSVRESRLSALMNGLARDVQWISGVRVRPPRLASYGGGAPPTLSPDGHDAVDHLIAAQLRSADDALLRETRRFFSALGEELVLDNPLEGAWRLKLAPFGAPSVGVSLCDTGEGYAQVLPVLVAIARAKVGGPGILCLEQPELHLHTRAQATLADLLVDAAVSVNSPRLLVETHSEVLLTSVQLAVAKGVLDPGMVRIHWVEARSNGTSDVSSVELDEFGRPNGTAIAGAFEEAVRIGHELLVAQGAGHSS